MSDKESEMKESEAAATSIIIKSGKDDQGNNLVVGSKAVVPHGFLANETGVVEGFRENGSAVSAFFRLDSDNEGRDRIVCLPLKALRVLLPPATSEVCGAESNPTPTTTSSSAAIVTDQDKSVSPLPEGSESEMNDGKFSSQPRRKKNQPNSFFLFPDPEPNVIQGFSNLLLGSSTLSGVSVFCTGFNELNIVLGDGLQAAESIEFYGKPGSGQTEISMFIAAHFCSSTVKSQTVIYFDLMHDFTATRFLSMCRGVHSALKNIQIIRPSSLRDLLYKVEKVQSKIRNKSSDFYGNLKLVVFDFPMIRFPAATIKEFSKLNDGIITVFVNHATTHCVTNQTNHGRGTALPKDIPILGKNCEADIWVLCEKDEQQFNLSRVSQTVQGTLTKCARGVVPKTFNMSLGGEARCCSYNYIVNVEGKPCSTFFQFNP